jgi:hypothetical protein
MFFSGETAIDLSLLPGQIIAAHVTCVRTANKFSMFCVHLNPVLAKRIQAFVDEHVQKSEVSILLLTEPLFLEKKFERTYWNNEL